MAETKTKGGLIIPEMAQKSTLEATVVAAGPGARWGEGVGYKGDWIEYLDIDAGGV